MPDEPWNGANFVIGWNEFNKFDQKFKNIKKIGKKFEFLFKNRHQKRRIWLTNRTDWLLWKCPIGADWLVGNRMLMCVGAWRWKCAFGVVVRFGMTGGTRPAPLLVVEMDDSPVLICGITSRATDSSQLSPFERAGICGTSRGDSGKETWNVGCVWLRWIELSLHGFSSLIGSTTFRRLNGLVRPGSSFIPFYDAPTVFTESGNFAHR